MRATLYDAPVVHDANQVGVCDSRKPVGYDQRGAVFISLQGFLHETLAFSVESGSSLVENQNRRILSTARAMLMRCR